LDDYFPADLFNELTNGKFKIIAEPGSYYACSAFTLAANVIARRDTKQTSLQEQHDRVALRAKTGLDLSEHNIDTSKTIMYYLNDGMYTSFHILYLDHAEVLPTLINDSRDMKTCRRFKSSIWGPTCDGIDVVVKETYLPELPINEFLVFQNMGAYSLSVSVPFNGMPIARCIYVVSTTYWAKLKDAFSDEPALADGKLINWLKENIQNSKKMNA
jgi:ornithine decarboxylase